MSRYLIQSLVKRPSLTEHACKAPANTYDVVPRHTHRFVGWDKNIPSIPSNPSGVDSLNKQYGKSDVTESTLRHLFPDDGFTGLYTEDQHTLGTSTGDMRTVSKVIFLILFCKILAD